MALPQHLHYGVGGRVSIDVSNLPSNAQVTIVDGDDSSVLTNETATVSTIDTTLSQAASKGQFAINVAANTGFAVGVTAFIQDDPEEILVREVEGTTIQLRRPLCEDHISGATVEGNRVYFDVNGASANTLFWDGRCEWNIDGVLQHYTAVECTKYPLGNLKASVQDIYDIEPKFYYMKDREADLDRLLESGMEEVLKRIARKAPNMRARVFPGSMEFRRAVALAALMLYYMRQRGEDAADLWNRYKDELDNEVDGICNVVPRDTDQDGIVEEDERISMRTVVVRRG